MLLMSVPANNMTTSEVLDAYRLRWQVEIAFKRLKSGLGIHKLPAKDSQLARSWLMAHLIIALMIDEAVTHVLDSPPVKTKRHYGTLSLWRLQSLLRQAFLSAILAVVLPKNTLKQLSRIMRHVCDPPRRRRNQAAEARITNLTLS
jgi:hypothetical protein